MGTGQVVRGVTAGSCGPNAESAPTTGRSRGRVKLTANTSGRIMATTPSAALRTDPSCQAPIRCTKRLQYVMLLFSSASSSSQPNAFSGKTGCGAGCNTRSLTHSQGGRGARAGRQSAQLASGFGLVSGNSRPCEAWKQGAPLTRGLRRELYGWRGCRLAPAVWVRRRRPCPRLVPVRSRLHSDRRARPRS